jgi:hypothetical protein
MRSTFGFVVGFASGWAVRSLADSPQGVGVKLIGVAQKTKERVAQWAAVEYERLADMYAEAQADEMPQSRADRGNEHKVEKRVAA